jgi:opacity protein-like surface antigen
MKKLATAVAAVAIIGTPAFAADMAVKARPQPTLAPVYSSWNGFYLGVNAGYSWSHNGVDTTASPGPFDVLNDFGGESNVAAARRRHRSDRSSAASPGAGKSGTIGNSHRNGLAALRRTSRASHIVTTPRPLRAHLAYRDFRWKRLFQQPR